MHIRGPCAAHELWQQSSRVWRLAAAAHAASRRLPPPPQVRLLEVARAELASLKPGRVSVVCVWASGPGSVRSLRRPTSHATPLFYCRPSIKSVATYSC